MNGNVGVLMWIVVYFFGLRASLYGCITALFGVELGPRYDEGGRISTYGRYGMVLLSNGVNRFGIGASMGALCLLFVSN
jgi:hypothetical protein